MKRNNIIVKGAKTNNLKNINIEIPINQVTVITGVSGSGKSSLVFDTLAAESQREINKNYSAYIQQLLPKYNKPDVDMIQNLPFSVVVNQKSISGNARSTVGTFTEIYTALRLLFSRKAQPFIGYSMAYSFNNPSGMCLDCQGLGYIREIDNDKLLDKYLSLNQGAIQFPTFQHGGWRLTRYTESGFFDNDLPLVNWSNDTLELLLYGKEQTPDQPTKSWHKTAKYLGIIPRLKKTFLNQEDSKYSKELTAITQTINCPTCHGTRLNKAARTAFLNGKTIAECSALPLSDLQKWLGNIVDKDVQSLLKDLNVKISNLITVGLSYLSLDRHTGTLSGGEGQRIKLANHLNSALSGVLYIFDEPSVGLHPHDLIGINRIFDLLAHKGNTVVIVDHDPDVIKRADNVINLGEEAGDNGGYVTFHGTYQELLTSETLTGKALINPGKVNKEKPLKENFIKLQHLNLHNLVDVNVNIPRNALTVISGPAGSGKSSLLYAFIKSQTAVTVLDQKPIHASTRSNILTYLDEFDALRKQFSEATGYSQSLFSFNGKGACPVCKGLGFVKLDLAYLGDEISVCESCQGTRYSEKTLGLRVKGYNIHHVLDFSVTKFSKVFPKFSAVTTILEACGLAYLQIGQSLNTLSGGELQRLKLAKNLLKDNVDTIVLDEPTSGLHESNIQQIINLLKKIIVNRQVTIIAVEHNLRFIGQADWVIDMGPGAGDQGGKVLFEGLPSSLMNNYQTNTSIAMGEYFTNS
ncbi:ATP-binding cassette domain-containing protein [Leuconostoc carnosum]|uniref:ATP-binding cassette domain-containing protein n=1 Tax=Leuconostoc carnosum TaxID=1252 RepID=UPI00123B204F|nr:ATP-binding cassette domain-containing protein [Leuconostoc carnosum]KAA8370854.1 ATP-binding cassette domain-containing protein [Leuconostoc carnosum]KAA8382496.1 ATP-binding cassette domain-containing protein [Leuconostoc carnosum]